MKRIGKIFLFFSAFGMSLSLEAKQVDLHFNHTVQEDLVLNVSIDDQLLSAPRQDSEARPLIYCQKLTIRNKGQQILEDCLPFVNQPCVFTLEDLRKHILEEGQPLLALYSLWSHSVKVLESVESQGQDPFYLLNCTGYCNQDDYVQGFIKLCHLLGISSRPAGIHGKQCYDFSSKNDWKLFDLLSDQLYLGLDNHSIVSSEEIMDDPFLALRTKADRKSNEIDFKKAWEQLAQFEIITPYLGQEVEFEQQDLKEKKGFDLYPGEQLVYHYQEMKEKIPLQQSLVQHVINADSRQEKGKIHYSSAFPIKAIYNGSSSPIYLKAQTLIIAPGETIWLSDGDIFDLKIKSQASLSGEIAIFSTCSSRVFPKLVRGINHVHLGTEQNPTSIDLVYDLNADLEKMPLCHLKVVNDRQEFDQGTPYFCLQSEQNVPLDSIWWQISSNPQFNLIPANFEQVDAFTGMITLPAITNTFFNANESYFFRVKGCINGVWGDWSEPFAFTVKKPEPITDVVFQKVGQHRYEISWKGHPDGTDYLVFGSNSLDFLPSLYCDTQINALVDGEIVEAESNDNLVAITAEPKLIVDGSLAYYRVIARNGEQLSVPSALIHVYDQSLIQARNVLQVIEISDQHKIVKRTEFPEGYSWTDIPEPAFPIPTERHIEQFLRSCSFVPTRTAIALRAYIMSPYITHDIWEIVQPYLLPENHPVKPKLDRMFSAKRIILNPDTFKKAGFKRYRPGRWSRIMASNHPNLLGYFIKAFADTELSIHQDWRKLIHRIEGAKSIRESVEKYGYQSLFKVPQKWLYMLPPEPSPPHSNRYLRKNFILVAEDMRILDHKANEKRYKKMSHSHMNALYVILDDVGLFDSVFAFNVPFCKDGKMAFIDTEHHHRWPVHFFKLSRYFSSSTDKYWHKLIQNGGPPGYQKQPRIPQ